MTSKLDLRREITARRRALGAQWVHESSTQIVERIEILDVFKDAKTIALYKALAGEVVLESLFALCWAAGKQTCIPVFNADRNMYEMAAVDQNTAYEIGNYGIMEPCQPDLTSLDRIDLIVVPGVAFDLDGNRVGRGGGYYDRLLAGFSGTTMAVAFDFQLFLQIPHAEHDIPVGWIVTESKIVDVCNEH